VHGEEAEIQIELRLIADAGLIGLPNAGKTSLLNALTGAVGKVGAYAFTTLDPNLGMLYGSVLADIPGLIEGRCGGQGPRGLNSCAISLARGSLCTVSRLSLRAPDARLQRGARRDV
jgi:ribosome-interacting GTPase 1